MLPSIRVCVLAFGLLSARLLAADSPTIEERLRRLEAVVGELREENTALRRELARQDALKTPDKAAMEAAKKEFEAYLIISALLTSVKITGRPARANGR